jgi:ribosomal protein S25
MTQSERQELDRAAEQILEAVRRRSATPRVITDTVARSGIEDSIVRAAIWDLIDRGVLVLDASLNLTTEVRAA